MKKLLFVFAMIVPLATFAQVEEDAVKNVVTSAYVQGIHNGGPIDDIRKGFHPSFTMLRFSNNEVNPLSIEEWIANIEKGRSQNPNPSTVKTEAKFLQISVAGTAANVVLELYRDNKKIFTDNLLLYKFNEGWRIVSKTFYRHP
ncbi:MAG: nuclear transport factor 2 family protein [Bacteroidota bacterium]